MKVTERDVRILSWIGEQFIVNTKELDRLLCVDAEKHHLQPIGEYFVRDLLNRWKRAGLVQTVYQLKRGSHVFLTAQGIRLTGLPYVPRTPGVSDVAHLTHHDGVNQVRLQLEYAAWKGHQVMSWVSERSLMQHEKLEAKEHPHQPARHRPDALIYTGDECVAIEVEKAYKRPSKLKGVLQGYLFTDWYTQVRYYCETPAIQRSIERILYSILNELPVLQCEHLKRKIFPLPMPPYA